MDLIKVRIIRGTTIADKPVFDREKGGDPPTFAPGDVVEVDRTLAQLLVGNSKAEYVSGDALNELAPSDKFAAKQAKETKAEEKAEAKAEEAEEKAEESAAKDEKAAKAKAKAKRTRKKAKAAKAAKEKEEEEEEETEEAPFVVETATAEPAAEEATWPKRY